MQQEQRQEKLTAKIAQLLTSVTPAAIRDIGRPKNIPACVPDCGWNHGKRKEKQSVFQNIFHTTTSGVVQAMLYWGSMILNTRDKL
jgi:hypothetical protein